MALFGTFPAVASVSLSAEGLGPSLTIDDLLESENLSTLDKGYLSATRPEQRADIPATRLNRRLGAKALADVDVWLRDRRFKEAELQAQKVLGVHPRSGLAYEVIGVVRFLRGDDNAAIAALSEAVQLEPNQPGPWAKLGTAQLRAGRMEQAGRSLRRAVELDPSDRYSRQKLGMLAEQAGDSAAAIHHYRLGLAGVDPNRLSVAVNLAALLNAEGRFAEAVDVLEGRVPVSLQSVDAQYTLGIALLGVRRAGPALEHLRIAQSMAPGHVPSAVAMSIALRKTGQQDAALQRIDQVLVADPELAYAHVERGRVLMAMGRLDEAEAAFDQAQVRGADPGLIAKLKSRVLLGKGDAAGAEQSLSAFIEAGSAGPEVYAMVSEYRLAQKDIAGAERVLEEGRRRYPESAYAAFRLGAFQAAVRRYEDAIETFGRADELAPGDPEVLKAILLSQVRLGDRQGALQTAERAYRLIPNKPESLLQLALQLEANGQKEQSIARYRELLEIQEANPLALNNLAVLLADSGQPEEAESYARRAVELLPTNGQVRDTLGRVLYEQRRYDEALEELDQAEKQAPDAGVILFHKALTLQALGRAKSARALAERAIALDADASWVEAARRITGD